MLRSLKFILALGFWVALEACSGQPSASQVETFVHENKRLILATNSQDNGIWAECPSESAEQAFRQAYSNGQVSNDCTPVGKELGQQDLQHQASQIKEIINWNLAEMAKAAADTPGEAVRQGSVAAFGSTIVCLILPMCREMLVVGSIASAWPVGLSIVLSFGKGVYDTYDTAWDLAEVEQQLQQLPNQILEAAASERPIPVHADIYQFMTDAVKHSQSIPEDSTE